MKKNKISDLSVPIDAKPNQKGSLNQNKSSSKSTKKKASKKPEGPSWPIFLQTAADNEIKERFSQEVSQYLQEKEEISRYCCLALLEPDDSIFTYQLDQIFNALNELNPLKEKDILLMLLSRGGSIEAAYQISKLCKSFSNNRFIVAVPRHAKSAATLIALGADEIHMSSLGQLGPIDPQLGGLPALGVAQALERIAALSEKHPGSADMFARYLREALTVEQIGYCDRISESAIQYAERLLSTKPQLKEKISTIAKELVHEYKDHNFVIDFAEAQQHLGTDWVKSDTIEIEFAEKIYKLFDMINLFLNVYQSKRLLVLGGLDTGALILKNQRS